MLLFCFLVKQLWLIQRTKLHHFKRKLPKEMSLEKIIAVQWDKTKKHQIFSAENISWCVQHTVCWVQASCPLPAICTSWRRGSIPLKDACLPWRGVAQLSCSLPVIPVAGEKGNQQLQRLPCICTSKLLERSPRENLHLPSNYPCAQKSVTLNSKFIYLFEFLIF